MNESGFIQAVHKKLPSSIYKWKISDRFNSGVADAYYSTAKGDIWVEYKYYPKGLPKKVKPKLSMLQIKWLAARYAEGRSVYVVVGSPTKCLIYTDLEWTKPKLTAVAGIDRADLIAWIEGKL
jgi:hypothetical protein